MPRALLISSVLVALALALAGCGDDAFRSDRPVLRLTLDEYRVVPQDISIRPGRVKFVVRNAGRLTHNLVVEVAPSDPADPPVELLRVDTMQPGQTAEPRKVTLQPGRYRLRCTIANHDDLGQYATLEVKG